MGKEDEIITELDPGPPFFILDTKRERAWRVVGDKREPISDPDFEAKVCLRSSPVDTDWFFEKTGLSAIPSEEA